MKLLCILVVSAVILKDANAGPIWDRARKMFGWDKAEDSSGSQHSVSVSPHFPGGASGYPGESPVGPSGYSGSSYQGKGAFGASAIRPGSSFGSNLDLQHASSGLFGAFAQPYGNSASSFLGKQQQQQYPSFGSYGSQGSSSGFGSSVGSAYGSASPQSSGSSNNYNGLFSVVDQTSQIGQLANGDLAASPSETYSNNEDLMKSFLKMAGSGNEQKVADLEAAASNGHYNYGQYPQLPMSPGPHPIMESDRGVIRYRTSPIKIGVAGSPYGLQQRQSSQAYGSSYLGQSGLGYGASLSSSGLSVSPYGDLQSAASVKRFIHKAQ